MNVPHDPALRLGVLLDPAAMGPVLRRSLGRAARLGRVRIARIAYKPGVRVVVLYEVEIDGRPEHAVAFAQAGRDLGARAVRPDLVDLAHRVDGRSPAAMPLVYDPGAKALVTWLPFDPRLPALAEAPGRLVELLARAGVDVPPGAEPAIVPDSYKPGSRVVLRLGAHVLKAYGSARAYERGAAGLRLAASLPFRTPAAEAVLPELRLTVQAAVDGRAPAPEAAAEIAGGLVRRLQSADVAAPRRGIPRLLLAMAAEKAALASHLVPDLAPRIRRLLDVLEVELPSPDRLLPAHGDFDAEQLLEGPAGEPAVLDFDDLCLAAPALDLATYLADCVVAGQAHEPVRERLLAGYGSRPAGLDWHFAVVVLARAPRPFQRAAPDWSERIEAMVRTVEEVVAA